MDSTKKIILVDEIEALPDDGSVFVSDTTDIKQISKGNMKSDLGISLLRNDVDDLDSAYRSHESRLISAETSITSLETSVHNVHEWKLLTIVGGNKEVELPDPTDYSELFVDVKAAGQPLWSVSTTLIREQIKSSNRRFYIGNSTISAEIAVNNSYIYLNSSKNGNSDCTSGSITSIWYR